jgi:hypothetical protein
MFQTKLVEKIKTHILCSIILLRKSCRLWDNVEKCCRAGQATDNNITRRMRIACWITEATNTHSEYVILMAFPRQQWLRERASVLRLYVPRLSRFMDNLFYTKRLNDWNCCVLIIGINCIALNYNLIFRTYLFNKGSLNSLPCFSVTDVS